MFFCTSFYAQKKKYTIRVITKRVISWYDTLLVVRKNSFNKEKNTAIKHGID